MRLARDMIPLRRKYANLHKNIVSPLLNPFILYQSTNSSALGLKISILLFSFLRTLQSVFLFLFLDCPEIWGLIA